MSGLPGQDQGPGDAYRHLVGVAELRRRVGPLLAAAVAEANEWHSTEAMLRSLLRGEPVARSNTAAARRMDRHNNALAIAGGASARSTEEVVFWARGMMEHALGSHGGSGHGNTAAWQAPSAWSDGGALSEWSPAQWSNLETARHFSDYRAAIAAGDAPERPSSGSGGAVEVRPHLRGGHPVEGHSRASPAR